MASGLRIRPAVLTPIHVTTEQWKSFLLRLLYYRRHQPHHHHRQPLLQPSTRFRTHPGLPSGANPGADERNLGADAAWRRWGFCRPADVPIPSALERAANGAELFTAWSRIEKISRANLDYQASVFPAPQQKWRFTPDEIGDLYFNGGGQRSGSSALYSAGFQADGSYHLGDKHTLRAGALAIIEGVSSDSTTKTFNLNAAGDPTTLTNIVDNHPLYGTVCRGLFAG